MIINNLGINFAGGGGKAAVLTAETFTENASFTPPEGVDGWSAVTVDVQAENRLNDFLKGNVTAITQDDLSGMTSIPQYSFFKKSGIKSVDMSSITGVSQYAFAGSGIKDIDVTGVKDIEVAAFSGCTSLTGITGMDTYTGTLNDNIFDSCTGLTGNFVTAAKTFSMAGNGTFKNCKNITSFTFLNNMDAIVPRSWYNPFEGCSGVTYMDLTHFYKVPILSSATAFNVFTQNYEIRVPEILYNSWTAATNWSDSAVVSHIVSYPNAYEPSVIKYTTNDDLSANLSTANTWGETVFISNEYDATTGGTATFYGPRFDVKANGFYDVKNISTVDLPSCDTINSYAFYGCTALTDVRLQSGLDYIYEGAFYDCTSLTGITIPESVKTIGGIAFKNTPIKSIVIPSGCFLGYASGTNNRGQVFAGSELTAATINNARISEKCFSGATKLEKLTFNGTITFDSTNSDVYNGCTAITDLVLNTTDTTLYNSGLYTSLSPSLTAVTFGEYFENLYARSGGGGYIFNANAQVKSITFNSTTPPLIATTGYPTFGQGCASTGVLYVPAGSESAYEAWKSNGIRNWTILPNTYADCQITTTAASETVKIGYTYQSLADLADVLVDGVSVKSSLVDDTYTFADAGTHIVRYVYTSSTATLATEQTDIESYSASTAVNEIGNYALSMTWGSSKLASIYLPNVTSIRKQSINNVIATDIYAPKIQTIGNKGVQFNNLLDPVSMPLTGITYIDNNAFRQTAIKEAHFGSGLTTWNYNVFNECASLSALTFDANTTGLTTMPSVGYATTSLLEVTFPDCIQTYGQNASYGLFSGSTALTGVTFGSGTTEFLGPLFDSSMSAVTEIKCYATTAPIIQSGWMGGVTASTGTLYVPAGSDYSTWAAELGSNWTVSDTL